MCASKLWTRNSRSHCNLPTLSVHNLLWVSHINLAVTVSSFRLQATLEVTQANMQYKLLSASPSELCLELLPRSTQQSLQPLHLSITMTKEDHFRLQVKFFFWAFFLVSDLFVPVLWSWVQEKRCCLCLRSVFSDPGFSGHRRPLGGVSGRPCKRAECCTVGSDGVLH